MSDKPVALQMADELDSLCDPYDSAIATELRRLHAALAEPERPVGINGLTEAETDASASVKGLVGKPEQEPVAHLWQHGETGRTRIIGNDEVWTASNQWFCVGPLYLGSAPTPREPLTDEEIDAINREGWFTILDFARAIERAHGIGESK